MIEPHPGGHPGYPCGSYVSALLRFLDKSREHGHIHMGCPLPILLVRHVPFVVEMPVGKPHPSVGTIVDFLHDDKERVVLNLLVFIIFPVHRVVGEVGSNQVKLMDTSTDAEWEIKSQSFGLPARTTGEFALRGITKGIK
jgi:hypothetical protein